jgi:hypothetical protein
MRFMVRMVHQFVLIVAALSVLTVAVPTQAQSTTPCLDQFAVLREATRAVSITGGKAEKERAGLVKLIDDAQALAAIGKTADAVTKLRNFTVKVDQLEAAGRLSTESAALLRTDAAATIACLQGTP